MSDPRFDFTEVEIELGEKAVAKIYQRKKQVYAKVDGPPPRRYGRPIGVGKNSPLVPY